MAIGEVCVRDVVIASRHTPVLAGARLMRQQHVGTIIITEESGAGNVPVGIVTDRDIVVEVLAEDLDPSGLSLGEIMNTDLVKILESEGVFQTIQLMRSKGVRRAPIVDSSGRLVGIVSVDDLLELLSDELSELARLISREQKVEAELRH